eukprot:9044446-Alexandrium_andersonii.AAC.1
MEAWRTDAFRSALFAWAQYADFVGRVQSLYLAIISASSSVVGGSPQATWPEPKTPPAARWVPSVVVQ